MAPSGSIRFPPLANASPSRATSTFWQLMVGSSIFGEGPTVKMKFMVELHCNREFMATMTVRESNQTSNKYIIIDGAYRTFRYSWLCCNICDKSVYCHRSLIISCFELFELKKMFQDTKIMMLNDKPSLFQVAHKEAECSTN